MKNFINNIIKLDWFNYIIKILIVLIWVYLYWAGSLIISRLITFIIVFLLIIGYSRATVLIMNLFINKKVNEYIRVNNEKFRKIVYILLEIYKWINPLIVFLAYTDTLLYKINRYISGTRFIHYNFVIYLLIKYLLMFGLVKLIIYKYYKFWYKLDKYSIIDILFKRMYGLILSILIFTDILNNIILYLSQYGIWIYIFIYYLISTLCIVYEFLYFYDFNIKILKLLYFNIIAIFTYLNILVSLQYIIASLLYITKLLDIYLQNYTKMNIIIYLRSNYTWLGQIISSILKIIAPRISENKNYKDYFLSKTKFSETQFMTAGRIFYYIAQDKRIPFKYFNYIGSLMNLGFFNAMFELYWDSFNNELSYKSFFNTISEVKGKPSIFLYMQLQELARLNVAHNQPINRLMNWIYFDMKSNKSSKFIEDSCNIFNEPLKLMDENEKIVVNKNLLYLKKVDDLRAKLMFFIIWDIEYYYNENNKDYTWDYWIIQEHELLDYEIFQMDDKYEPKFFNNKKLLKFYDPEENIAYFNRLFNVLGIINNVYYIDNTEMIVDDVQYYVSEKFNNYNEKYVELLNIINSCEFIRCYEQRCMCGKFSLYEVEIAYKINDYFQDLRKEWKGNITKEGLEDRNWRLLKELEELMGK